MGNPSVVLIGVQGVGKSSLGVLAATAYRRRLVESERVFADIHGISPNQYRKLHGADACQTQHDAILEQVLRTHDQDAIIVGTITDLQGLGAARLRDFAQTHPVIHIMREAKGVQSYLQTPSLELTRHLLHVSGPLLRSCTNFTFFNLTEQSEGQPNLDHPAGLSLTLKRTERAFLQLLSTVVGPPSIPSHHLSYLLPHFPVVQRKFTLSSVLHVEDVISGRVDLDSIQIGVDAMELRGECIDDEEGVCRLAEAFAMLRRACIIPIILSVPSAPQHCFRLAPEFSVIDLAQGDVGVTTLIQGRGRTEVIGAVNLDQRPSRGWEDAWTEYQRGARLGCDLVSITMPADGDDDLQLQAFRARAEVEGRAGLIAYNTGLEGRRSRCSNRILTPVNDEWLAARAVMNALFATFVYPSLKFIVYGADVSYSLSPAMYSEAFSVCGMPHSIRTHSAPSLSDLRELIAQPDFGGAAIVQPYKTDVINLATNLSPEARQIGSVNTIIPYRPDSSLEETLVNRPRGGSALYGFNTDWIGIRACLIRGLSPANAIRPSSTGLIIGAGGQARSAAYSLTTLGVRHIVIYNRTRSRAQALADSYPGGRVTVINSFDDPWPEGLRLPSMIVSSIPPSSAADFQIPSSWLASPTGGVLIELTYAPRRNYNLGPNWIVMDYFDVLPEQAYAQFEIFTGRWAPRKLMRDCVERARAETGEHVAACWRI
ncbi:hypothetical protein K470DRAFT_292570 [Piedraia hortae CBS 480.64]|uniref:Uncharacterized protein n=1 Tax=Piedraia hortae CBS 480.64 TaxID=1314780 RepID=A0A6A7CA05_9PEZI|nr:hypothetical protein K470DRAFT_292570 [Piedraia hortae CBS 480.64]